MTFIVVDVETDGPCPVLYSMVSFGAAVVNEKLDKTFFAKTKPISDTWQTEALAISKISREEHLNYPDPGVAMSQFADWLTDINKPIFVSDNLAFDWQFINYYFHKYVGMNPFGFSGKRIGDMFAGFYKDPYYKWKKHRKTNHDHNPVNDAKGNAEALMYLRAQGFKFSV